MERFFFHDRVDIRNAVILETSQVARTFIGDELEFPGLRKVFCGTPTEALSVLAEGGVDFLTTAMELPDYNGLELVSRIRAEGDENLVVALITSYSDMDFYRSAYRQGVDIIIQKNFRKGDLFRCFERILLPSEKQNKILFVDDSMIIRMTYCHAMRNPKFGILEAESAEAALEIIEKQGDEILLIISDENMDGMSGSELCHTIRLKTPHASMPFVLVSGEEEKIAQGKTQEAFINYYLPKPAEKAEILSIAELYSKRWTSHRKNLKTILPLR